MAAIALTATHLMLMDMIIESIVTAGAEYQKIKAMSEEEAQAAIELWQAKKDLVDAKIKAH